MHALAATRTAWSPMGGAFLPSVRLAGASAPRLSAPVYPVRSGARRFTLGQTAQEWFEKAKEEVARFEFLKGRIAAIDNRIERENLITWLGKTDVPDTPEYRYNSVKSDLATDVAEEGVGAYNVARRQGRVSELEAINDEFEERIAAAIQTHGERQPPGQQPPTPTAKPTPDYTLPILGGAVLVGLAILLT